MQFLKTISLNLVLILILALGTATANTAPEAPGRLEVTGQAVITTAPDTARIILGVETTSTSVNAATSANAERMATVLEALKDLGIPNSHVATSGYTIYSYRDIYQGSTVDGAQEQTIYNVQNKVTVTTDRLDEVGRIVDAAVQAGANQIQSVSFDLADKELLQLEALDAATKQAMGKARAMAESAGVSLGGISGMEEEYGTYAPFNESVQKMAQGLGDAGTSITPGEVEVRAVVKMTFWF